MREHPEYKYRPRRKPKPLVKKDGTSRYGFPLPFFPPGIDPMLAARSFAFSPHYAAALAAATAFGAPSTPSSNILSPNEIINPFSALPMGSTAIPPRVSAASSSRLGRGNENLNMVRTKTRERSDTSSPSMVYPSYSTVNPQEGFLAFMQKYHEEQTNMLANAQKLPSQTDSESLKRNETCKVIKASKVEDTDEDMDDRGAYDEDEESIGGDSEEDELLDVDGNEVVEKTSYFCNEKKADTIISSKIILGKYFIEDIFACNVLSH